MHGMYVGKRADIKTHKVANLFLNDNNAIYCKYELLTKGRVTKGDRLQISIVTFWLCLGTITTMVKCGSRVVKVNIGTGGSAIQSNK